MYNMFMNKKIFKENKKKFNLSYIKWNKKKGKYVSLSSREKKGLEVLILNHIPEGMEILNSVYEIIKLWDTKGPNPKTSIDLMLKNKSFYNNIVFIYGRNLKSTDREVFSYASFDERVKEEISLSINIAYPKSQVPRDQREDGIIGGAGSNTRHSMISYAFKTLNCEKVKTQVHSEKAYKSLLNLGFIEVK